MGFWLGDTTGMSGDSASPAPYSNSPYPGAGGGVGTPSPAFPVASPGSASIPGMAGFGGTPTPSPLGFGIPGFGGTFPGSDPLSALLSSAGGTGGFNPLSLLGGGLGGDLAGLLGFGPSQDGGIGGDLGGALGGGLGTLLGGALLGPLGAFGGTFLGDIISGLLSGGLNKNVKPQGAVSALEGSGNPIEALLGKYIQSQGINQGFDLSEPGGTPFNPAAYGDILQLLSGMKLPVTGQGEIPLGNVPGAQKPVTLYGFQQLPHLQSLMPNATELSASQLAQIAPQLGRMANTAKIGGLRGLLERANQLAMKLKAAESY